MQQPGDFFIGHKAVEKKAGFMIAHGIEGYLQSHSISMNDIDVV